MRTVVLLVASIAGAACARAPLGVRSLDGHPAVLPAYPARLAAHGVEGAALIELAWQSDGTVDTTRTHVLRTTHRDFAEAAVAAVRTWRVAPPDAESRQVEILFALTYPRCTARDSSRVPASRARWLRDERGLLRLLVEAGDCRPAGPPVALSVGSAALRARE